MDFCTTWPFKSSKCIYRFLTMLTHASCIFKFILQFLWLSRILFLVDDYGFYQSESRKCSIFYYCDDSKWNFATIGPSKSAKCIYRFLTMITQVQCIFKFIPKFLKISKILFLFVWFWGLSKWIQKMHFEHTEHISKTTKISIKTEN